MIGPRYRPKTRTFARWLRGVFVLQRTKYRWRQAPVRVVFVEQGQ